MKYLTNQLIKSKEIVVSFCTPSIVQHDCIPYHKDLNEADLSTLLKFIRDNIGKPLVLTGAGISTESGIPDYRSPDKGVYAKSGNLKIRQPVTFQEFYKDSFFRQKFWARHYIGYLLYASKKPNINHFILTKWVENGKIKHIITQNVDELQEKSGLPNYNITHIHGKFDQVTCLQCGDQIFRSTLQTELETINQGWKYFVLDVSPDAYAHITQQDIKKFKGPTCKTCGSDFLKPNVVFIGENVLPKITVHIDNLIKESQYLLVLGSSLQMYSAYRIVKAFHLAQKPICIINIGPTRADYLANLKIDAKLGDVLPILDDKSAFS